MPSKILHFLWKMLSNSLATGSNLKRRHILTDDQCKRCCQAAETEKHIFFDCPYAKSLWRASGISNHTINSSTATFEEKIKECFHCSTSSSLSHLQKLPVWILWRIWKSRNLLIFQQRHISWQISLQQARKDAKEWHDFSNQDLNTSTRSRTIGWTPGNKTWQRPPEDWIKCNVDVFFISNTLESKAGWVYRDHYGVYKGAGQALGVQVKNAFESELQSILIALQFAHTQGYQEIAKGRLVF